MKKRLLTTILTLSMVAGSLSACGTEEVAPEPTPEPTLAPTPTPTPTPAPVSENVVEVKPVEINVCFCSEPETLDPAFISDENSKTLLVNMFSGLARVNTNGEVVADSATVLPEGTVNEDGTVTYTYTLKDGLKWSDGEDVKSEDFAFAWKRIADPENESEYANLFSVIDGYNDLYSEDEEESEDKKDEKKDEDEEEDTKKEEKPEGLNIVCPDDKTLSVTLYKETGNWNQLLTLPAFFPVREDVVKDKKWSWDPETLICNGAFTMTEWDHKNTITLSRNEAYYDADNISIELIQCHLSDDAEEMYEGFTSGDWQYIEDVPLDKLEELKDDARLHNNGARTSTYLVFNANSAVIKGDEKQKESVRKALGILVDRASITKDITASGEIPASSYIAMGFSDYDGAEFYENCGVNKDFTGYFNTGDNKGNKEKAMEVLKQYYTFDEESEKFTDFPALSYLYDKNDDISEDIGKYLRDTLEEIGIDVDLESVKKDEYEERVLSGDYTIILDTIHSDEDNVMNFLTPYSGGENIAGLGMNDHAKNKVYNMDLAPFGTDIMVKGGSWAETYDVILEAIKSSETEKDKYSLMHMAEDQLMQTGCIIPLYYSTERYMISDELTNVYISPTGLKYFSYATLAE